MKKYLKPIIEIFEFQSAQNMALNPYEAVISKDGKTTTYQLALLGDVSLITPI